MDAGEESKRGEREEEAFSDEDEAVHSTRSKRRKVKGSSGNADSGGGAGAGRGSGLYLDTIQRYMLDFDFEKVCSVSLSNLNVYACLVCGKYFQGMATKVVKHRISLELIVLSASCLGN